MKISPTAPGLLQRLLAACFAAATLHAASSPGSSPSSSGDQPIKLEEVEVTGSRIRGLLSEATIQPMMILTAEEIERTGAATLADAFRYIPEITSYTEGIFQHSPNAFGVLQGDTTSPRVTVNLRGAPAGGTLLLINGRRAPRNGQEQAGQDSFDISGVPLAAVERVEVLLDGASAIYGADAVGGVVNIILKRGYKRTDFRITYENAFEPDVHALTASLSHGFAHGKLSGTLTLNFEKAGNLMWVDRDFLTTFDRRPWRGSNALSTTTPQLNGSLSLPAGNAAGVPANTLVTIPRGATGTNKAPADYVAAGAIPPGTDQAFWASYNSPYERRSLAFSAEYELQPWLSAFTEFRASTGETVQRGAPLWVNGISIPANAPGNVFGVPVVMRRILLDEPRIVRTSNTRNLSSVIGLRGRLPREWRFEASISHNFTRPEFLDPVGSTVDSAKYLAALANPSPPLRPNLVYDATTPGLNPNAPGVLDSIGASYGMLERGVSWTYEAKADGPIYTFWAGALRAAVGAEYREEYVDFPLQVPADVFSARARNRYVTGLFSEMRMPLLSEKQGIPLVNRLEITAAVRNDRYQEFQGATKPRYGALYRPVKWLVFRGSYGEGYKLPTLNQLYAPQRISTVFFGSSSFDIYRNNEPLTGSMPTIAGGNPNLVPEETESTTAGAVFEVPGKWFKGLSFSYDFYDHNYLNRISASLSLADRMAIFPELFTRGPNKPTDPAGWPGPILSYDGRAINVSTNRITGWDAGVKYFRPTPIGSFNLSFHASRAYRNENRPKPGAPPATNAVPESLPKKMSGSLFWQKGAYETGVLVSYRDVFKRSLTERLTPSAIRWDWRGGLDFGKTRWANAAAEHWYRRWLADTKVHLTLFNVFDEIPPMNAVGMPDSSIIDPRGMRYSISFSKSFGGGNASLPVRR